MLAVIRRTLVESWRAVLAWTLVLVAVMSLYLPLYPSIGLDGQMVDLLDTLPSSLVKSLGFDQITSGAGYAQATVYGLLGYALPAVAAIGWGSAAVAGAEESGRLELDLAHGIGRVGYVAAQEITLVIRTAWLGMAMGAYLLVLNDPAELGLEPANVAAVTASAVGLMLASGSAALCVGALTGRRAWATGTGALVAVGGYLCNALANQLEDLDWLRTLSPYSWAFHEQPLAEGATAGLWPLWIGVALLLAAAFPALAGRDLRG